MPRTSMPAPPPTNPSKQTRKIIKDADGSIIMRTEIIEERKMTKERLLTHRHNLEMELVRAEENVQRIKGDLKEVNEIIAEMEEAEGGA